MRRAHMDCGWLVAGANGPVKGPTEDRQFIGLALGYDFCAEHESDARWVTEAFGVRQPEYPMGVEDRLMTQVPERLQFVRYDYQPRDRRRKPTPAAALRYATWGELLARETAAERLAHEASFWNDVRDKDHRPEQDDLVTAWTDRSGFVVNVRGEGNIAMLEALYQAMLERKVAIAPGSAVGFMRQPLSFILIERMSEEQKARVLAQDQDYKALSEAAKATGIEERLAAAGRKWYALGPGWSNGPGSPVRFFLNPREQHRYSHGWFSVEDLDAWIRDEGPVLGGQTEKQFNGLMPDAAIRLQRALQDRHPGWTQWQHEHYLPMNGPDSPAVRVFLANGEGARKTLELTFDEARALAESVVEPPAA